MLTGGVGGREQIEHIKVLLGIMPERLRAELGKGVREALAPLKKEIPATAEAYMPKRHGYGVLLAATTKVTYRVSTTTDVRATVTVKAKGKSEDRDVKARNRGEMRHPLFGLRKHWHLTHVRPGFVDDPVEHARKRVVDKAEDARDKMADMLLRE